MVLIVWLVAAATAIDVSTVQRIHELYWRQADALNLAAQIAGADAPTRVEAARALGRLGTADALPVLGGLRKDRSVPVQIAVADALATVPRGSDVVRDWLAELGSPGPGRAGERVQRYSALVRALGVGGTSPADVRAVTAALRESWPVASVAARALTRMAVREVPGVQTAVPALISRLRAPDPRVVRDVSRALAHVDLRGQVTPTDVAVVRDRLRRGTTPEAQAWLLLAVWPALTEAEREEQFVAGATETARSVRLASLAALAPSDLPADVVSTFLADPDPWIRHTAIDVLRRDPSFEAIAALERHAQEADPWEAARALRALAIADDGRALDFREPDPIRAALVPHIVRPETLIRLALRDEVPMVRSAAAVTLERRGDSGALGLRWGRRLVNADDPVVRWAGVRLLRRGGRGTVAELRDRLVQEKHHAVQTELLRGLVAQARWVRADRQLQTLLIRGRRSDSPAVRQAATSLAKALRLDPGAPAAGEGPIVADVRAIRGARVWTDQGSFRIELNPDVAPRAVATFASLAEEGFYEGLLFYASDPGQEVRTGCPRGDGWGDAGVVVPAEPSPEDLRPGTVAMLGHPLGGVGSQWIVRTGDGARPPAVSPLTTIGRVVAGEHVLARLSAGARVERIVIERIAGRGSG